MKRERHRGVPGALQLWARNLAAAGYGYPTRREGERIVEDPDERTRTLADLIEHGMTRSIVTWHHDAEDAPKGRIENSRYTAIELAAIAWHTLSGRDPSTNNLMRIIPPAPLTAVRVTREALRDIRHLRFTQARHDAVQGSWYVEIERPRGSLPDAVSMWTRSTGDGPMTNLAGIWTRAPWATASEPLLVTACWQGALGGEVTVGGQRLAAGNPGGHEADDALADTLGQTLLEDARAVVGAVMAENPRRTFDRAMHRERGTRPIVRRRNDERELQRLWRQGTRERLLSAPLLQRFTRFETGDSNPRTGLDALIAAARHACRSEGHNLIRTRTIPVGWSQETETGITVWNVELHALQSTQEVIEWDLEEMLQNPVSGALWHIGELLYMVMGTLGEKLDLEYTEPCAVHAILVPERLWDTLIEAGPPPENETGIGASELHQIWYLEIEKPHREEPRAVAVTAHRSGQSDIFSLLAIWTEGPEASSAEPFALSLTWDNSNIDIDAVRLTPTPRIMEHDEKVLQAAKRRTRVLHERQIWTRVAGAYAEHLAHELETGITLLPTFGNERGGAPRPRPGTNRRRQPTGTAPSGIFAIIRAPDPGSPTGTERAHDETKGSGDPLTERQRVRPHWKRQRWGKGGLLRKNILVAAYNRGPEPGADQIVMRRLANRRHGTGPKS